MSDWMRWFLTPPGLPDGDEARSARVLHTCLVASASVDVVAEGILLLVAPRLGVVGLPWYGFAVAMSVVGIVALKRGWLRTVGASFLGSTFLLVNGAAVLYGGLPGPAVQTNLVIIGLAGVIFGGGAAGVAAVAAALAGVGLVLAESRGLVGSVSPGVAGLLVYFMNLSLMAGLLGIGDAALRGALRELRRARDLARESQTGLEEALGAAEAASRAKSQFLANMSHELRTPLNAIIGYAEMLHEDQADPQVRSDLERIGDSGRHLLALINDVLDLSKIEAGRMELVREEFRVADACTEAVAMVGPLAARNRNEVRAEVADDVGTMRSDVVRVRQILYNLVSNACKFTKDGTVVVRARRMGAALVFEVTDTGIGMSREVQERLFRPFSQADASTTRQFGGTGLGLALVRHFAAMLGGEVAVASEVGVGSTFTVMLPDQVSMSTPAGAADLPAAVGAVVLAIDDDPQVHEILSRTLARRGIRVVSALSGPEGLAVAKTLQPRAITLDVTMPGMDGWETLAALKADPETRDIPVAMLSAVDGALRGRQLGAASWLQKPIDRRRLLDGIVQLIGQPADVLVVDDDENLRALALRVLEAQGCTARGAANGQEALAELRRQRPALVLLDLVMPEMDGFQLLEEMRRSPELADVPVVVLTAADADAALRSRLGGDTPVLTKAADVEASVLEALYATPMGTPRRTHPGPPK